MFFIWTLTVVYHSISDHRVTPSLIVIREVGFVAIATRKALLHIVTKVTQHSKDHLRHTHTHTPEKMSEYCVNVSQSREVLLVYLVLECILQS